MAGPWEAYRQPAAAPAAAPEPEEAADPWYEDFAEGVVSSGMGTFFGAKDLLGFGTEDDRKMLEEWKRDAGESGWGTGGQIVGEIAQLAVPGGLILKGAKAASKAKSLLKAGQALPRTAKAVKAVTGPVTGPLGAGTVAATGLGATRLPGEGETREMNAAVEGALALAGGKLGELATLGIKKAPDAIKYLVDGGYLTPAMAANSKFVKGIEAVMDVTPFLARGTKDARAKAEKEFTQKAIDRARPLGADKITKEFGQDGVAELRDQYTKAYKDAWAQAKKPTAMDLARIVTQKNKILKSGMVPKDAAGKINAAIDQISTVKDPQAFDRVLRKLKDTKSIFEDPDALEAVEALRAAYRNSMGPKAAAAIKAVDATYPNYLAVRKASSAAMGPKGDFSPKQLVSASRQKAASETQAATGEAPLMDLAQQGVSTVGEKLGGQPLDWLRRLSGMAPSPPMKWAGNIGIGENPVQRVVLRKLDEAMRKRDIARGIIPAGVGTGLEE